MSNVTVAVEAAEMTSSSNNNNNNNNNSSSNGNKMEESMNDSDDTWMCSTFNQDGGCLAVGTGEGFRICNVSPFQETFRRRHPISSTGGILHMEMLFRCNLLALVCCSFPNKVYIWDDHIGRPIGELSFRQKVLRVKLCRDRICVALRDRIYVYNFGNLKLLDTIVTGENSKGLLCISTDTTTTTTTSSSSTTTSSTNCHNWILACPSGVVKGQVRVELYGHRKSNLIQAHDHKLAAMALTADGTLLATASERGTVIRLFDTTSTKPLREFRRGVERANISCLAFSLDKSWLASAGSDRGTVHVFRVTTPKETTSSTSSSSTLSSGKKWATRLLVGSTSTSGTESSHQQIRGIPHPQLCAFVPDKPRTIAVAGLDDNGNGCLLLATFSDIKNGEEPQRMAYHRFFKKDPHYEHKNNHKKQPQKSTTKDKEEEHTKVYMQDDQEEDFTLNVSNQLETIVFDDADGFVNIETTTTTTDANTNNKTFNETKVLNESDLLSQQQASTEIFQDATERDEDLNNKTKKIVDKMNQSTEKDKDDVNLPTNKTVGGIIDEKLKSNQTTTPADKSNAHPSKTKEESAMSNSTEKS